MTYEINITQTLRLHFSALVEANSRDEAMVKFAEQNARGVFDIEWAEASDNEEILNEEVTVCRAD